MKHFAILVVATLSAAGCESSKAEAPSATHQAPGTSSPAPAPSAAERHRVTVTVTVTDSGYEPGSISAHAGQPLTLVFKRTTDQGCGQQVVFPDRDIRRDLPLNQEVEVELTPRENETIAFTCGMGMYRGSVVASAR